MALPTLNKVLLVGNLTRDPEHKTLRTGASLCIFGIAVDRSYKDGAGEWKTETVFLEVTAWGRLGDYCTDRLRKGIGVYVDGHLQMRQWTTDDGQKRTLLNIVAERVLALDRTPRAVSSAEAASTENPPSAIPAEE